jgi:hypothetical protein
VSDERIEQATAFAQAAGKHIGGDVRELGEVVPTDDRPARTPEAAALADRALELLREEIGLLERMRAEFATEKAHGAPAASSPRLDAMAARLEGMSRFALRMGLLSPGEARQVWTEARRAGLHDRPATGQAAAPPEVTAQDEAHGDITEGEH